MGKEDRKLVVLEFLARKDIALPPEAIFVNLRIEGATFEKRTMMNYLEELEEEGFLDRLPEKMKYRRITDRGRHYVIANS